MKRLLRRTLVRFVILLSTASRHQKGIHAAAQRGGDSHNAQGKYNGHNEANELEGTMSRFTSNPKSPNGAQEHSPACKGRVTNAFH